MKIAVDSDVLFDLLLDDVRHAAASRARLISAARSGSVVACPAVYAEIAAAFPQAQEVEAFLQDLSVVLEGFEQPALVAAAQAWKRYAATRGQPGCPSCGTRVALTCPSCGHPLAPRQHVLADFLIGGHALAQADNLLTRDRGYYRTYFPGLTMFDPDA
jgi:predicted nucleic acid-binding protein